MSPMVLVYVGLGILGLLWLIGLGCIIAGIAEDEADAIPTLFGFLLATAVVLLIVGGVWTSNQKDQSTMPPALKESFGTGISD